jgi:hypothetical protein
MSVDPDVLVGVVERNTAAVTTLGHQQERTVASLDRLGEVMDKSCRVLDRVESATKGIGPRCDEAVNQVNLHAETVVGKAGTKLTWVIASGAILVALSELFNGAGTRWLGLLK